MSKSQLYKMLWVYDAINRRGGASFKEVQALWEREMRDDFGPLSNSTFRGYIRALEDMMDVNIECVASDGYRYRAEQPPGESAARRQMLGAFSVERLLNHRRTLAGRVVYPDVASGGELLTTVIGAMRRGVTLKISYRRFGSDAPRAHHVEPYALRVFDNRWYLLASNADNGGLYHLALDRMESVEATDTPFGLDRHFDPADYYRDSFGVIVLPDHAMKTQTVVIRVLNGSHRADLLRSLPLHHSQRELEGNADYALMQYRLKPTDDFLAAVLAMGSEAEVLSPASFRRAVADEARKMARLYAPD